MKPKVFISKCWTHKVNRIGVNLHYARTMTGRCSNFLVFHLMFWKINLNYLVFLPTYLNGKWLDSFHSFPGSQLARTTGSFEYSRDSQMWHLSKRVITSFNYLICNLFYFTFSILKLIFPLGFLFSLKKYLYQNFHII